MRFGLALYRTLARLYPRPFRDRFGAPMEQTFRDAWRDRGGDSVFLVSTCGDLVMGALMERLFHNPLQRHHRLLLAGLACAAPFFVLNALLNLDVPAVRWLFRDVISADVLRTNPLGMGVFVVIIGLLAVGAALILRPAFERGADGARRVRAVNLIAGGLLALFFVLLVSALGAEVYECRALGVPNCD